MNSIIQQFFRISRRQPGTTIITVAGLATGLAATFLILMWAMDEMSYEQFNEHIDQIYMVNQDQNYSGEIYRVRVTPHPCAPVWEAEIPGITKTTRMVRLHKILIGVGENSYYESNIIAADSGLFNIFTHKVLQGNVHAAIRNPHAIILTKKLAEKYFGKEDPIGKTIEWENTATFTVEAVIENLPRNTDLNYEAIIPYAYQVEAGLTNDSWSNNTIFTFVQVHPGVDIGEINHQLTEIVSKHKDSNTTKFFLFPLADFHLKSLYGFGNGQKAIVKVYGFLAVALFIILIACINFINLSTAKASFRAKEIGIRKASGGSKMQLALQFLGESLVMVLLSMIVAFVLVAVSLGIFNTISGKQFEVADLFHGSFLLAFLLISILTAFLAGIYPAIYLSSLNPVTVLRGEKLKGSLTSWLRKILMVVQFTLSISIALGAIFMFLQIKYMQQKTLGYDKEHLICIPMSKNMRNQYELAKSELLKTTGVESVTASLANPVFLGSNSSGVDWDGKDPHQEVLVGMNGIDVDYLQTMGMKIVEGRDFSSGFKGDRVKDTTGNFLINEELAKRMGAGNIAGKRFSFLGVSGVVAGVMKDFHFEGAGEPITPMAFFLTEGKDLNVMLVKLAPGNIPETLEKTKQAWNRVIPDYPFEYTFVDQDYDALYEKETRMGLLLKYFTIIALIIACMGLYGLSAWEASKRTREIGIRKAMGAGIFTILLRLSREYMMLMLIAIALAFILGWFFIGEMLNEFAYHIPMKPEIFLLTGLLALAIAMITVGFHTLRAAEINPAKALRTE